MGFPPSGSHGTWHAASDAVGHPTMDASGVQTRAGLSLSRKWTQSSSWAREAELHERCSSCGPSVRQEQAPPSYSLYYFGG